MKVIYQFLLLYTQYLELLLFFVWLFKCWMLLYSFPLKLTSVTLMVMSLFCTKNRFLFEEQALILGEALPRVIWDTKKHSFVFVKV